MRSFRLIGIMVIALVAVIYFLSIAAGDVMIGVILGLTTFVTVVSALKPSSSVGRRPS